MNQVYRVVWNAGLGLFQAVSELARAQGPQSGADHRIKLPRSGPALNSVPKALAFAVAAATAVMAQGAMAQVIVSGSGSSYTLGSGSSPALTVTNATSVQVSGSLGTLTNNGTIAGNAIPNDATDGTITTLTNSASAAIANAGTIVQLTNAGTITGGLYNTGTIGGSGVANGVTNTGTIDMLLNDTGGTIAGATAAINNSHTGVIGQLTNNGVITGGISNSGNIGSTVVNYGLNNNTGSIDVLNNNADGTITGASIGVLNGWITTDGAKMGTLNNSGTIIGSQLAAVVNTGSIGTLLNSGVIAGGYAGVDTDGGIHTLTNTAGGTISGTSIGIMSAQSTLPGGAHTIGTLTNSGVIVGGSYGILNVSATITALTNIAGGTISGTVINSFPVTSAGVVNSGSPTYGEALIGTLTNSGLITGGMFGIENNGGTIAALNNNAGGTITGTVAGINNHSFSTAFGGGTVAVGVSAIGTLTNGGLITGTTYGIDNGGGAIAALMNDAGGVISGATAISNSGTIGALSNSGTITGTAYAINNTGSLGPITNSGVINGNIASSSALSINGGTAATFGTLTGGTITSPSVAFNAGNLLLNDNITTSQATGTVNNAGAVLQVNRPVTITGNYTQTAGTLQVGAVSSTQSGELLVTGNSSITGGTVGVVPAGYALAQGQVYVAVDTAGTATYSPNQVTAKGFNVSSAVEATAAGHSDLVLTVETPITTDTGTSGTGTGTTGTGTTSTGTTSTPPVTTYAKIASNPNATAALTGLLSNTSINNSQLLNLYNAVLGSVENGSPATANRIGQQLAPSQAGMGAAAPTFGAMGVVGSHVDAMRLAQAEGADGTTDIDGTTGVATGNSPAEWNVWGQAFGGHASQGERDDVDGYSANYGGLLVGVDRAINDNWRAGGVFTYTNTAVDSTGNTAGDTARVNGYGLVGYAGYAASNSPWYVNLSGAVVQQEYDTTRIVSMQGFEGAADGHYSGQQYVLQAETGLPMALSRVTLTPLASLTYSYQHQGSYTETGGNGAGLSVDATEASSVKSGLGFRLAQAFSSHYGEVVPDVQVQWIHEYDHTREATGASFSVNPSQTGFTTVGATPISDLADISVGVTLLRANNLSVSARYELQAGAGFISQTGIVRLQQQF
jgi:outer membrane autotransporter protein